MKLYEQLGGESVVSKVADDFHDRVLRDEFLAPWFAGVNLESLRTHLGAYLAVALGGPEGYGGRSIRSTHGELRVTSQAFDAVLRHFTESFQAAGTPHELIEKVQHRLGALRAVVVDARPGRQ